MVGTCISPLGKNLGYQKCLMLDHIVPSKQQKITNSDFVNAVQIFGWKDTPRWIQGKSLLLMIGLLVIYIGCDNNKCWINNAAISSKLVIRIELQFVLTL